MTAFTRLIPQAVPKWPIWDEDSDDVKVYFGIDFSNFRSESVKTSHQFWDPSILETCCARSFSVCLHGTNLVQCTDSDNLVLSLVRRGFVHKITISEDSVSG